MVWYGNGTVLKAMLRYSIVMVQCSKLCYGMVWLWYSVESYVMAMVQCSKLCYGNGTVSHVVMVWYGNGTVHNASYMFFSTLQ